jgi:hypothetical protein
MTKEVDSSLFALL